MKTKYTMSATVTTALSLASAASLLAQDALTTKPIISPTNNVIVQGGKDSKAVVSGTAPQEQNWNLHFQNTDIVEGTPPFPAQYSGPNSLNNNGQVKETVTADLFAGARLWDGAEVHADLLGWQGYGLNSTEGIESFPNGDAYKIGTHTPDFSFERLFIRQTIGLGGEQEDVADGPLTLAGKQDVSRITLTLGRYSALDIFDQNTYAGDPHSQFMSWGLMDDLAWDYPQDAIGYTTGFSAELNQPSWTLRYGFFTEPANKNGNTGEDNYLTYLSNGSTDGSYGEFGKSWGMVTEFEQRWSVDSHPGAFRVLPWIDEANMVNYNDATSLLLANGPGADLSAARAYRFKYGVGLNMEQEVAKNIGVFSRLGWNDGQEEAWTNTDANWAVSLGVSAKGEAWGRPGDGCGIGVGMNGASRANQKYLEAGGTGILAGDGALSYSPEKDLEVYYDWNVWKSVHFALDYQFVDDPAFNSARGPVSVFGARLHWEL